MDDVNGQSVNPSATDEPIYPSPKHQRRVDFVQPQRQKRKFEDGTPSAKPARSLRSAIGKVQKERYVYAPLGPDEDIRVLIVEKGRGPDSDGRRDAETVRCRLVASALPPGQGKPATSNVIPYEALSYYWGQEDVSIPIEITSYSPSAPLARFGVAQQKFWIRRNLHAALVQLRSAEKDIFLWVDAICINQDDQKEKTEQVSKMHQIYSKAESICIWLGVGEIDTKTNRQTFEFIREMLDLRRLDQLIVSEDHADKWLAFVQLMRNRWFSRRWVVQELALAKEATVHYGEELIQWTDFRDAVALFVTKHDQIKQLLSKSRITPEPDPIGDMRALGANTLVEATSNLFRRSDSNEILERLLSLEILVSTLLAFEAKDPRDTVYAVLSIAKDTPYSDSSTTMDPRITPNYSKTLADLCTDFIAYCVEQSKSLDIICRHWAPVAKGEWADKWQDVYMPTWVSLISGSAFGEPEAALQGRSNGDGLVGTPNRQHQKNYNASANLPPAAKFGTLSDSNSNCAARHSRPAEKREDSASFLGGHTGGLGPPMPTSNDISNRCNGILSVKGTVLDTIGKLSPRAPQGMILKESLEMAGWTTGSEPEKVPESLWRTLVADRGPHGINAPSWYYRSCLEYLNQATQNGDLNTDTLIKDPSTPSTMVTFLKRVQQVVWNRKFLRSSKENRPDLDELFGLGPTDAQEGDYICILFGCSVPVILRKDGTKDDRFSFLGEEDDLFTFVGEAYVHGMMDGEAVSKISPQHPYDDYKTFHIR